VAPVPPIPGLHARHLGDHPGPCKHQCSAFMTTRIALLAYRSSLTGMRRRALAHWSCTPLHANGLRTLAILSPVTTKVRSPFERGTLSVRSPKPSRRRITELAAQEEAPHRSARLVFPPLCGWPWPSRGRGRFLTATAVYAGLGIGLSTLHGRRLQSLQCGLDRHRRNMQEARKRLVELENEKDRGRHREGA
jgi:hypothetical protein